MKVVCGKAVLGVSLSDNIRNTVIRRKTKVTDVAYQVEMAVWQWSGLNLFVF